MIAKATTHEQLKELIQTLIRAEDDQFIKKEANRQREKLNDWYAGYRRGLGHDMFEIGVHIAKYEPTVQPSLSDIGWWENFDQRFRFDGALAYLKQGKSPDFVLGFCQGARVSA